jgi:tetratricopeptide (TPR) repeat protein
VTSHGEPRPCPSPEVLHKFIEGTLGRGPARDVAKHIETCRDCRFIVSETMEFLREDGELLNEDSSEPSSSGRGWWLTLAAAAIIGVVGLSAVWFFAPTDPGRRFDRAIATTPVRPVEGRLSGVPYARYSAKMGAGGRTSPEHLQVLAHAVLSETAANDAREWHRRGVASLFDHDVAGAVEALQRATQLAPRDARYWSDLSAARLALGLRKDDAALLAGATADAQRALSLDPALAAARFNLVLSLERRGLRDLATAESLRYRDTDPHSGWAAELRAVQQRLRH